MRNQGENASNQGDGNVENQCGNARNQDDSL